MDFGDQPTQSKQIPWKLIAIIAGGIVLAAGIFGGVFYLIRQNAPQTTSTAAPNTLFGKPLVPTSSTDPCATDLNAEACRIAKAKDLAISSKKSDACDALKDADKDDCYWSVARVAKDLGLCTKITDKDISARCSKELSASAAFSASDIALCDKITDGEIKTNCQKVITSTKSLVCASTDTDCEFTRVLAAANQAEDADVCAVLDPKREAECRAQVLVNDPDHDDLDSTQEIVLYNTDPHKADTDGDGYSDGAEVHSGHDPLKK